MHIPTTFNVPADRLKEGDVIDLDGQKAILVSTFVYNGENRTKLVRSIDTGIEDVRFPENEMIEVFAKK